MHVDLEGEGVDELHALRLQVADDAGEVDLGDRHALLVHDVEPGALHSLLEAGNVGVDAADVGVDQRGTC